MNNNPPYPPAPQAGLDDPFENEMASLLNATASGEDAQAPAVGGLPIQTITPRHNAIMDFILANPTIQMQHVAAHFKVSGSWLSIIIHSDCFQAQLREKQEEMFNVMLVPLAEKLTGVAHIAVDKLGKQIEDSMDPSFILDASDKVLGRLGFGGKSAGAVNVNVNASNTVHTVTTNVLEAARERMLAKQKPVIEHTKDTEDTEDGHVPGEEPAPVPAPAVSHDDLWGN